MRFIPSPRRRWRRDINDGCHLFSVHGAAGSIFVGDMDINPLTIKYDPNVQKFLKGLADHLGQDSQLEFITCKSGQGKAGKQLLEALSKYFARQGKRVDVILHTDLVAPTALGAQHLGNGSKTGYYIPAPRGSNSAEGPYDN